MEGLRYVVIATLLFATVRGQRRSSDVVTIPVREEQDPGYVIGSLIPEAGLDRKYNMEQISKLRFKATEHSRDAGNYITVEQETGVLKINKKIDREDICPVKLKCFLTYDVVVTPVEYFQIIKVMVDILDLNDNAPTFPEREITLEISESSIPGTTFAVPSARDQDGGDNSVHEHILKQSDSHMFNLQVKQVAEGHADVRLMLIDHLDREIMDNYQLTIEAYDNGKPRLKGVLKVNIIVTDANDNGPEFQVEKYEVKVPENVPSGTTIVHVHATDKDIGSNGDIHYSFSSKTFQEYGHIFDIDPQSGEVFIRGTLDFEEGSMYVLTVVAQDGGPGSLTSQTDIVINVEDINDQAPVVSVNTLSKSAEVREKAPINTFVAHLSVKDSDTGDGGKFHCNISSEQFSMSQLNPAEYTIATKIVFDREQQSRYTFHVTCADKGTSPLTSVTEIAVRIVDVNDHAPRFRPSTYTVHTVENRPSGTIIAQVNATDLDAGLNGQVTYSLSYAVQKKLLIDPETGIITTQVLLDYETDQQINFIVYAQDKGEPPRTSTASIHLYIKDEDDELPQFEKTKYTFYVLEGRIHGVQVGQVKATDADSYPHNQFEFSLEPFRSPRGVFGIDPLTGVISTLETLDRESRPVYHLLVVASPKDTPSQRSECTVVVHVKDINDNSPKFDFPVVGFNDTIFLSNQAVIGHEVTKLHAHDMDEGANARLLYRITGGNSEKYFSHDTSSGKVFVYKKLSDLTDRLFILNVEVSDQGEPQYSENSILYINVRSSIEFLPKPQSGSTSSEDNFLASNTMTLILSCAAGILLVLIALTVAIIICLRSKRQRGNSQTAMDTKETQKMLAPPSPEKNKGVELKQQNNGLSAVIDMKPNHVITNNHKTVDPRPEHTLTKNGTAIQNGYIKDYSTYGNKQNGHQYRPYSHNIPQVNTASQEYANNYRNAQNAGARMSSVSGEYVHYDPVDTDVL